MAQQLPPLAARRSGGGGLSSRLSAVDGGLGSTKRSTARPDTRPDISLGATKRAEARARPPSLRQAACTELLQGGHVQAFAQLFELTRGDGADQAEKIRVLQKHLARAEDADRQGDAAAAYQARKSVADYLEHTGDMAAAMLFRRQCQEVAGGSDGAGGADTRRIEASYLQGLSLEKQGDLAAALAAFADMHALTAGRAGLEDPLTHSSACACQARVLLQLGQQGEGAGDTAAAARHYTAALAAAQEGALSDLETRANYHLGLLSELLDQPAEVLRHLELYLESATAKDPLQHSTACACISRAYVALGDTDMATKYLEQLIQSATELNQPAIIVEAASRFGSLCHAQVPTRMKKKSEARKRRRRRRRRRRRIK